MTKKMHAPSEGIYDGPVVRVSHHRSTFHSAVKRFGPWIAQAVADLTADHPNLFRMPCLW
jgi:hypothetical protein